MRWLARSIATREPELRRFWVGAVLAGIDAAAPATARALSMSLRPCQRSML